MRLCLLKKEQKSFTLYISYGYTTSTSCWESFGSFDRYESRDFVGLICPMSNAPDSLARCQIIAMGVTFHYMSKVDIVTTIATECARVAL